MKSPEPHTGYTELLKLSKKITKQTWDQHSELVDFWLSTLDFYFESIMSTDRVDINLGSQDEKFALVTRAAFASLGLGHSRSALDATCRGDYHHAFFSIRFMAELVIHGNYVRLYPSEAVRWYPQHASAHTSNNPPKTSTALSKVKAGISKGELAQQAMINLVYDCLKEGNEWGAHPSQEILRHVMNQSGDRLLLGTRYIRETAIAALDRGGLMTLLLIEDIFQGVMEDSDQNLAIRQSLWDKRRELMSSYWPTSSDSI